jgi:hypothetical protein
MDGRTEGARFSAERETGAPPLALKLPVHLKYDVRSAGKARGKRPVIDRKVSCGRAASQPRSLARSPASPSPSPADVVGGPICFLSSLGLKTMTARNENAEEEGLKTD